MTGAPYRLAGSAEPPDRVEAPFPNRLEAAGVPYCVERVPPPPKRLEAPGVPY